MPTDIDALIAEVKLHCDDVRRVIYLRDRNLIRNLADIAEKQSLELKRCREALKKVREAARKSNTEEKFGEAVTEIMEDVIAALTHKEPAHDQQ